MSLEVIDANNDVIIDDDDDSTVGGIDYDEEKETQSFNLNSDIIIQLRQNDPCITSLRIRYSTISDIDWVNEGECFSNNTHLKELMIEEEEAYDIENCKAFFLAIARNRSIKKLIICGQLIDAGEIMYIISPFIEKNAYLRNIEFHMDVGDRGAKLLASAISNAKYKLLRKVELDLTDVSDDSAAKIFIALGEHNIVELCLSSTVGRKGCVAISSLLSGSTLKKLSFCWCNLGDEGITNISKALLNNNTLKVFSYSGEDELVTNYGMLQFARCMQNPNSTLEELELDDLNFEDSALCALSIGLGGIKTLKKVKLTSYGTSAHGWHSFFDSLQRSTSLESLMVVGNGMNNKAAKDLSISLAGYSTIHTLHLPFPNFSEKGAIALGRSFVNKSLASLDLSHVSANSSFGRTGWEALFSALPESMETLRLYDAGVHNDSLDVLLNFLATNESLKDIDLDENRTISKAGWIDFFSRLPSNKLEKLSLNGNNIDDEVISSVVSALVGGSRCPHLKQLGLSRNEISPAGWSEVSTLLQESIMKLEKLTVGGKDEYRIDDGALNVFANSLVNNSSLKALHIWGSFESITEMGWSTLSNVLCNKSTVDSIYSSNHTLERITSPHWEDDVPRDIISSLYMNRVVRTAQKKILRHHFRTDACMKLLADMNTTVIPKVLAWGGRDGTNCNALFHIFRSMPGLFDLAPKKVRM